MPHLKVRQPKGFIVFIHHGKVSAVKLFMDICQQAYDFDELRSLEQEIKLWMGEGQSKVLSMQLSGYCVPHDIFPE